MRRPPASGAQRLVRKGGRGWPPAAPTPAGQWVLEIPDLPRVTLNSRTHWAAQARVKKQWRTLVASLARARRVPKHLEHPRVELFCYPPDRRRRDADNLVPLLKCCLDGLRDAHVLVDDTPDHVDALIPKIRPPRSVAEARGRGWRYDLVITLNGGTP